jgi:hypothetical protein
LEEDSWTSSLLELGTTVGTHFVSIHLRLRLLPGTIRGLVKWHLYSTHDGAEDRDVGALKFEGEEKQHFTASYKYPSLDVEREKKE